jgi:transposase
MQYEGRSLKCGLWEAGSSIMIMPLLTQHCKLDISCQNFQFLPFHDPPCSPDLSPPNFFLFPKLKITLKGRRFQTVEDIITNVTNDLKAIPQKSFEHCFQNWERWLQRCNAAQEDYFEGDKIQ